LASFLARFLVEQSCFHSSSGSTRVPQAHTEAPPQVHTEAPPEVCTEAMRVSLQHAVPMATAAVRHPERR